MPCGEIPKTGLKSGNMKKSFLFSLILFPCLLWAQLNPITDSIPMRDGRKLAATLHIPSGCAQCPVILIQTPYNRLWYNAIGLPLGVGTNINASNYAFVIVDWRGFYGSAAAAYSGSPTRGQDGYDVVQWIASRSWCDGKVGTWGPSALGRVQYLTARENPPNLVCINPVVAAPQYNYLEYFPGGVYRTEYVEQLDALGFGMSTILLNNPVKNNLWLFSELSNYYPDSIKVPAFLIGGWYDHNSEMMLAFFNGLRNSSPLSVRDKHRILIGPWVHGGNSTAFVGSPNQGQLSYPNAAYRNDSLSLRFFDFHLRGISNGWDLTPYVDYYQMGENNWQSSAVWPPTGMSNFNLYFHGGGILNNQVPTVSSGFQTYSYDPQNPSPTIGGSTLRADLVQGPYDQAPQVESRNDLLKFSSIILGQNVVLKGKPKVVLRVSSNRPDTDFSVRLTDVYPDGRSILIGEGIRRMRFRNGYFASDTGAMTPGNIYTCEIELNPLAHTFLAGHRIRVDISSSNYPRYNRNDNSGGVMYPGLDGDSLRAPQVAANTVYMNVMDNSYIVLPLVDFAGGVFEEYGGNPVHIYPNPAGDYVTVDYGKGEAPEGISIFSLAGGEVQLLQTKNSGPGQLEIDISHLPAGVYLLRLRGKEGFRFAKLVKGE
jgi:uncharacterized protein